MPQQLRSCSSVSTELWCVRTKCLLYHHPPCSPETTTSLSHSQGQRYYFFSTLCCSHTPRSLSRQVSSLPVSLLLIHFLPFFSPPLLPTESHLFYESWSSLPLLANSIPTTISIVTLFSIWVRASFIQFIPGDTELLQPHSTARWLSNSWRMCWKWLEGKVSDAEHCLSCRPPGGKSRWCRGAPQAFTEPRHYLTTLLLFPHPRCAYVHASLSLVLVTWSPKKAGSVGSYDPLSQSVLTPWSNAFPNQSVFEKSPLPRIRCSPASTSGQFLLCWHTNKLKLQMYEGVLHFRTETMWKWSRRAS